MKQKLHYLDVLRFAACVFVIYYHMLVEAIFKNILNLETTMKYYSNANIHIAMLAVSLFFMVSGSGLMLSSKENFCLKSYIKSRFLRILIPYYVVYGLSFFVKYFINGTPVFHERIPSWRFLFTLLGMDEYLSMHGIATFSLSIGEWFLGCLMIIYVLFPFLRICMLRHKYVTILLSTILFFLFSNTEVFQTDPHLNILFKLYEFLLGMFLVLVRKEIRYKCLCWTLPVIGLFLFCPFTLPLPEAIRITLLSVSIYLTIMQAEPLLKKRTFLQRFLWHFNQYSFEIYLIHHVIIFTLLDIFAKILTSALLLIPFYLITLVIILAAAFIIKIISEQIKTIFFK